MDDSQLLQQIQQGNQQAFFTLVQRHQKSALRFAYAIVKDYQQAEDLSQEAFLQIFQNISKYQEKGKFKTYLLVILKNLCLNFLHKKKKSPLQPIPPTSLTSTPTPIPPPSQQLEQNENQQLLQQFLQQLNEKERLILILREFEKLPFQQIATILNISTSNAKVISHRIWKKLSKLHQNSPSTTPQTTT